MKESTRRRKERYILKAAGRIIERKGLTNFTMEEVADEALITKVTLYTYFVSKENLTMAIAHDIFQDMHERLKKVVVDSKKTTGLQACLNIKGGLLNFFVEDPFRATMMMEFISVYNMPKDKLSDAMAKSSFREALNAETKELTDLLNGELERGRKDGSIQNDTPSEILFLYVWNCMTGFISMTSTPGFQDESIKDFLKHLAKFHETVAKVMLSGEAKV